MSQIDILCVAHSTSLGFPKGAAMIGFCFSEQLKRHLLVISSGIVAASGSIAAKVRVHIVMLSGGKINRDIGQDAVFLTLREVGRAKGKW